MSCFWFWRKVRKGKERSIVALRSEERRWKVKDSYETAANAEFSAKVYKLDSSPLNRLAGPSRGLPDRKLVMQEASGPLDSIERLCSLP